MLGQLLCHLVDCVMNFLGSFGSIFAQSYFIWSQVLSKGVICLLLHLCCVPYTVFASLHDFFLHFKNAFRWFNAWCVVTRNANIGKHFLFCLFTPIPFYVFNLLNTPHMHACNVSWLYAIYLYVFKTNVLKGIVRPKIRIVVVII